MGDLIEKPELWEQRASSPRKEYKEDANVIPLAKAQKKPQPTMEEKLVYYGKKFPAGIGQLPHQDLIGASSRLSESVAKKVAETQAAVFKLKKTSIENEAYFLMTNLCGGIERNRPYMARLEKFADAVDSLEEEEFDRLPRTAKENIIDLLAFYTTKKHKLE